MTDSRTETSFRANSLSPSGSLKNLVFVAMIGVSWGIGAQGLCSLIAAVSTDLVPSIAGRALSAIRVGALVAIVAILGFGLFMQRLKASNKAYIRVHILAVSVILWLAFSFGPLSLQFRDSIAFTLDFFKFRLSWLVAYSLAALAVYFVLLRLLRDRNIPRLLTPSLLTVGLASLLLAETFRSKPVELPNVIFLSACSLRADHLGAWGYGANTSPNIDSLARASFVFKTAMAHVPRTGPSYVSSFTGLYPVNHGVYTNRDRLDEQVQTLTEKLKGAGYITVSHLQGAWPSTLLNLDQGFDYVFHRGMPIFKPLKTLDDAILSVWNAMRAFIEEKFVLESSVMTDEAIRFIEENAEGGPFFFHIAWNYTHDPYVPPETFRQKFANNDDDSPQAWIDLYDAELNFFDAQLGRVVRALERSGMLENSWVVLFADHGEELNRAKADGGVQFGHGNWLFDSSLNIPLLIRPPNGYELEPRPIRDVVGSIDIAPTVLQIASADTSGLDGKSLFDLMRGGARPDGRAFSLARACEALEDSVTSVRTSDWRYIETLTADGSVNCELYEHRFDRHEETDNVILLYQDVASTLAGYLRHWRNSQKRRY